MIKVQFPNLNGLRFLAAFGVIIHHIEQVKSLYGLPNLWSTPFISNLGGLGVSLFFVLSGFLISFLLIEEAKLFKSIDVRKFYIRRSLRIWPLYYVVCLLGFLILPAMSFYNVPGDSAVWDNVLWQKLALYLTFCPHIATAVLPGVAYAGVLWSVGVEEWFYLGWPWVIKYLRGSEFLVLSGIILVLSCAKTIFPINSGQLGIFLYCLRFNCMAIGAIFAILVHNKEFSIPKQILSICYRTDIQLFTYLFLAIAMMQGWTFGITGCPLGELVYSVLFGIIVLNLATNKQSILNIENRPMRWLGEISYGLYCYNWIAIMSVVLLFKYFCPHIKPHVFSYAIIPVSIVLTVIISALSYEFIERRFLLLKQRLFTRVPTITISGDGDESNDEFNNTSSKPMAKVV